jgi:hypothetical protein
MRINSKDTVGSYPVLLVRKLVRALTNRLYWDLETVERILRLRPNEASGVIKALEAAGLAKANRARSQEVCHHAAGAILRYRYCCEADYSPDGRESVGSVHGTITTDSSHVWRSSSSSLAP